MTISASEAKVPVEHTDRFFIGGRWVTPSSDSTISVIDSHTEQVYLTVAEAQAADMDHAITAAKEAFDHGPWPRLTHAERAAYLRALGDEVVMVEALAAAFSKVKVGDPFDPASQMGPLAAERQRDRVEGYIAKGIEIGATLAAGGGRPKDLDRGWYVEPTVFGNVDNSSVIAQEEIFGPVLSVIPAADEDDAVRIANDTIYGLHGAVFTNDVDRAREVAGQIRTGAIGHNGFKSDFDMGHGGFKQSGIGREGGVDGLLPFLESKAMLLDGPTSRYSDVQL
jgi:acyl-CoA reductase-like NAD-dependent aldehyde dehydrogenase